MKGVAGTGVMNLQSITEFQLIVYLSGPQLYCFGAGGCKKALKKATVHYLLSTKQQTDTVRDWLMNIVEPKSQIFPSDKTAKRG